MTNRYSETDIRKLHADFKTEKKYNAKLIIFDQAFGIIPFGFPPFDSRLSVFFQKETLDHLAGIFKAERNNPGLTERKFYFGETFIFNIKPANSNSAVYSNYILSDFLTRAPVFDEEWQKQFDKIQIEILLDEANAVVNDIECALLQEYDKSFKLQCMAVFFKAYADSFLNHRQTPEKKRKFTELYLYSLGVTYFNYVSVLKNKRTELQAQPAFKANAADSGTRKELLQELGITEFLRLKYPALNEEEFDQKLGEIILQLTHQQTNTD